MNGTNIIIVNANQMNEIVDKWWSGMTYGTKDSVLRVKENKDGDFELTLEEVVTTESDK